ncbi:MAG TPA: alpha/beta hydrolase-fold protein [Solirubrobacteraceae bacterium]|nr:alpha/beta hydrolase-fold protein [Solirubrobacteraceae bacterium]
MALREVEGPAGAPWERPIHGMLDRLVVESELLAGNPLGDPARRPLYVYRPPGVEHDHPRPLPSVYVIQGFTGQLDMWHNRTWLEPTMVERIDAMFATGDCPPAIIVFVDCWTSYGGSQYLNSIALGRYQDHLCDEVTAFVDERYPTAADRDRRGLTGKSSGGYGAMVVPMMRPDVFGALASHAGDALFEACYLPEFPEVARALRDDHEGSYERFFERLAEAERLEPSLAKPLEAYGYAAAYSPDPAIPGKALLPFDVATGRLVDDVWAQWLEHDPVRMAPARAEALRSMRRIYLDAGRSDEYYLDLGAQAFAAELQTLGVEHTLDLFDGTHAGLMYRYPAAIRELVVALSG